MIWSKSKRLLDLGKIDNFYVSRGKIKIRIQENSKLLSITHVEDLKKEFPDVDLTPSSWRKPLTIKLLTFSYRISSSARCSVTTMHSYYGLFKDFCHGYVETNHFISSCNQSDWNPSKACLLSLIVYVLTVVNISMSQILFAKESQVFFAKQFLWYFYITSVQLPRLLV